jgi:hypothetical protein
LTYHDLEAGFCAECGTDLKQKYAHLLPDDLNEAFRAIDNTGTALILSQIYHSEEKEKGSQAATP